MEEAPCRNFIDPRYVQVAVPARPWVTQPTGAVVTADEEQRVRATVAGPPRPPTGSSPVHRTALSQAPMTLLADGCAVAVYGMMLPTT